MPGTLPPRTGATMGLAIEMGSPSGRVSKRARVAAERRLHTALFGDWTPDPLPPQPSKAETLRREAKNLRELAARGMRVRAFTRQADWCETEADRIEKENANA